MLKSPNCLAGRIPSQERIEGRAAVVSEHEVLAGWAAAELETALTVPPDQTAAAFFDVDNTMMQGASIYWFARGLAARKYFTTGDLVRFAWGQLKFRLLATELHGDMSQAKQSEEHTSELQSQSNLVCRLLLEKKKNDKVPQHASAPSISQ